jgi:Family of unknown function (DUF6266)
MAKLLSGINGPFSGKVGTVVGYLWKGKAVMRGLPRERSGGPSPAQMQQHAKFALMHKFLRPLLSFLNVTYSSVAVQMTGFSKAFSYNVKNSITGTHPELGIDYSRVMLSQGDLQNVLSAEVIVSADGKLVFSWKDNSGTGSAKTTDQAFVAVYCEELNQWVYELNPVARKAGNCTIDVTKMKGREVHTYIGFISNDGKDATNSLYTGMVKL